MNILFFLLIKKKFYVHVVCAEGVIDLFKGNRVLNEKSL